MIDRICIAPYGTEIAFGKCTFGTFLRGERKSRRTEVAVYAHTASEIGRTLRGIVDERPWTVHVGKAEAVGTRTVEHLASVEMVSEAIVEDCTKGHAVGRRTLLRWIDPARKVEAVFLGMANVEAIETAHLAPAVAPPALDEHQKIRGRTVGKIGALNVVVGIWNISAEIGRKKEPAADTTGRTGAHRRDVAGGKGKSCIGAGGYVKTDLSAGRQDGRSRDNGYAVGGRLFVGYEYHTAGKDAAGGVVYNNLAHAFGKV